MSFFFGPRRRGRSFGASALEDPALAFIGGAITSFDADERDPFQFDLFNNVPLFPNTAIRVSGVRFSKWRGPIGPAVQPSSLVQRVVNVAAPSYTAVLPFTNLTNQEQEVTTGITNPDVYRVLSVSGNRLGMNQTVIIIGTNAAGKSIADAITLVGTTPASGVKPFQTVRKIILPPRSSSDQQVSVGTTTSLGLFIPFSITTDLRQQARKAADADSYRTETLGAPIPRGRPSMSGRSVPATVSSSRSWQASSSLRNTGTQSVVSAPRRRGRRFSSTFRSRSRKAGWPGPPGRCLRRRRDRRRRHSGSSSAAQRGRPYWCGCPPSDRRCSLRPRPR